LDYFTHCTAKKAIVLFEIEIDIEHCQTSVADVHSRERVNSSRDELTLSKKTGLS
jgi:hypothetical protein